MIITMDSLTEREKYRILTSCIVPRPIAWVTTIDHNGVVNAAPFSYFTGISIEPPLVVFAVERRHGNKKDTVINIEETKEFVVNVVTIDNVNEMNETSQDYDHDIDELAFSSLTEIPSQVVKPPSIQESPVHLECKLDQIIEVGSSPHSLIIGEVKVITLKDDLYDNGRLDMNKLQAVGRMGGRYYVKSDSLFELDRLDWRKTTI